MRKYFQQPSVGLALVLIATASAILAGWHFRIPWLKGSMLGTYVAPTTALCFILLSAVILFFATENRFAVWLGYLISASVLVFSFATLIEWITQLDFGIDRIFFAHRLSDWDLPYPGRFSVNSGVAFILASSSLLTIRRTFASVVGETLAGLILLVSYLSLIGYVYSIPALYSIGNVMALTTALLFAILSVAILYCGNRHLVRIISSPYAGGIVSRRFISAVLLTMPLLGWIAIQIRVHNLLSREMNIALLVLASVLIFTILTLRTATALNEIDRQRLQTQDALRYSEQLQADALQQIKVNLKRLELIESSVGLGTWEFDPLTGMSHWPPGISAVWGLPRREHRVTLDEFKSRIYPDDRENVVRTVENALKERDNYDLEFRVIWPDLSIHWLSARGTVIRAADGTATKVLGIALDVTERHQTEKALRESEKLAATGRLAATIAHEINNPLEAVVNLVFLAKNDPSLATEARNLLDAADVELARVSHMVRQTLGFYRDSSKPVWVDVSETVVQIVNLYRNKLQRKNVQLDMETSPARMHGFEGELRQVISNLISNAIDAVPLDGHVTIRVRQLRNHVSITVGDNGHGISPENRERLFQPFFTTKRDIGTGLGLWVSKGIIEKHRGHIRFRSSTRPGASGTIFSIRLPLDNSSAIAQTAALAG
ncbi:MAG TPA: ATP-binding protein [Terriglobales bacterium]|nr:ATP-binding protein [Terriglobales bacterium]